MNNEYSLTLKKKKVLSEYRDPLIQAIGLVTDSVTIKKEAFESICDINKENFEKNVKSFTESLERFASLESKIKNEQELTLGDFNLLTIICTEASVIMTNGGQTMLDSAKQLQNLAKAFIA